MHKSSFSFFLALLLCLSASLSFAEARYPFDSAKQEAQFTALLKELRCFVCQNQDLSDSNAPLAKDLKKEVYHLVMNGKTDGEITSYLTARYGDFILFKPPVKGLTMMLWLGPFLFLCLGLLIYWRTCIRRSIT